MRNRIERLRDGRQLIANLLRQALADSVVEPHDSIDRSCGPVEPLQWIDPSNLARSLVRRRRSLAYMAVWLIVFAMMNAGQGVGDFHRGQCLPFWEDACRNDRPWACNDTFTVAVEPLPGRLWLGLQRTRHSQD